MKIVPELAILDFNRWVEYKKMSSHKRESNKESEESIIQEICEGGISIDDDCKIHYKLKFEIKKEESEETVTDSLTFRPRISYGALKKHMKNVSATDPEARIIAHIAALTGLSKGIVGLLDSEDMDVCKNIIMYFL